MMVVASGLPIASKYARSASWEPGSEAPHGEYEGRQWAVDLTRRGSQLIEREDTVRLTPLGAEVSRVYEDGTRFEAPVPEFVLTLPRTLH